MTPLERIQTANRITRYLAKRLAMARLHNEQHPDNPLMVADVTKLLDAFMIDPMEVGEPDCDETHGLNLRYLQSLTPPRRHFLEMFIVIEARRFLNEWAKEADSPTD